MTDPTAAPPPADPLAQALSLNVEHLRNLRVAGRAEGGEAVNAYASFYALSPAERKAAAVRLVALLKRSRRRMVRRLHAAYELDYRFGSDGGNTEDIESHIQTVTGWIVWLENRYRLRPSARLLAHIRGEERKQVLPDERDTTRSRRQKQPQGWPR